MKVKIKRRKALLLTKEDSSKLMKNSLIQVAYLASNLKLVPVQLMVPIAQWIARWTSNPEVVGSNPTGDEVLSVICHSTFLIAKCTNCIGSSTFPNPPLTLYIC